MIFAGAMYEIVIKFLSADLAVVRVGSWYFPLVVKGRGFYEHSFLHAPLNLFLELILLKGIVFVVVLLNVVRGTWSAGNMKQGVKYERSWLKEGI